MGGRGVRGWGLGALDSQGVYRQPAALAKIADEGCRWATRAAPSLFIDRVWKAFGECDLYEVLDCWT